MQRDRKLRGLMLDLAKAIHEAIGIDSPRVFIAVFALAGLIAFGTLGWVVDRGYRIRLHQQESSVVNPARFDFHLESDQIVRTRVKMKHFGKPISIEVSTVYLVVTNKGQRHIDAIGYRIFGGAEVPIEFSVPPQNSGRVNITENIVDAVVGEDYGSSPVAPTVSALNIAVSCVPDGETVHIPSDTKEYGIEVTRGQASLKINVVRHGRTA